MPDPETLTTSSLLEWLKSGNGSNRSDAAMELGSRRIASVWRPLCRLLRDTWWVARCSAAESLGMIGAPQAIPHLRRALKTLNANVKLYVSESLADLGDWVSRPEFEKMRRSRNERIRMAGASALYILGDRERLPEVIELLRSPHSANQCAAANTLAYVTRSEDVLQAMAGLQKALDVEKSPAPISYFKKAIRELRQI